MAADFHGGKKGGSSAGDAADELLSDDALRYIGQILFEEGIDEKLDRLLEPTPALQATEKALYEALAEENHPPSGDLSPVIPEDASSSICRNDDGDSGGGSFIVDFSSCCSSDASLEAELASQFRRGVEEAQKFLVNETQLLINFEANGSFMVHQAPSPKTGEAYTFVDLEAATEDVEDGVIRESGSKSSMKNPHCDRCISDVEDHRGSQHSSISSENNVRSEVFDEILLANASGYPFSFGVSEGKKDKKMCPLEGSGAGDSDGGEVGKNLTDLLIRCSQAVSIGAHWFADELLKKVRCHASPHGDASQRLAHYFADGLQARIAGNGSHVYRSLVSRKRSSVDVLKAYYLYLSACPFRRTALFFANRTIYQQAVSAERLHIVDFGIYYGFQWPCFMQFLSERPGGPPKLKITGVELPHPGFRPSEVVEETGCRLADYAKSFGIPFVYYPIAARWETIKPEHIKTEQGELLIINCMLRLHTLADEAAVAASVDCPRNKVLATMRKLNPDMFITSIKNGAFGVPFFATRFKEALYTYSSIFEMVARNIPAEDPGRLMIERELLGREIVNVVACEGDERVMRVETYKQCAARIERAGFEQLPLKDEMVVESKLKVKNMFHKDFLLEQDCNWLLQGWKGRVCFGISCWKPREA